MGETWDFARCVSVLSGEIDLLKEIAAAQNMVKQAVLDREWIDFDEKTAEVNRLGEKLALLETEREQFFPAEKDYHARVMSLPQEQSREITRLHRELKKETLGMRMLNESFLAYINEAKTIAASYLEAVCPARGGKLYTQKGYKVSQDLKSMVVNNQL